MRVLIFSDLHGHAFKSYSVPDQKTGLSSRLMDSIRVLDEIYKICYQHGVDVVLFGGDLYHIRTPITVSTFNAIHESIAKIRTVAHVGLLVGNHDQSNRAGDIHSISTYKAVVEVFDRPAWYTLPGDLHVYAVPYMENKTDISVAIQQGVQTKPAGTTVLLGHFDLSGAKAGANFVRIANDAPTTLDLQADNFDQIFLGHYHIPQKLLANARYIGATHHHNWGDVGQDRGYWMWDTEQGCEFSEPDLVQIASAPKFQMVHHKDLSKVPGNAIKNTFLRVVYDAAPTKEQWDLAVESIAQFNPRWVDYYLEPSKISSAHTGATLFHPGQDFDTMVTEYSKKNCPDKLDAEILAELGHELLQLARGDEAC